MTQLSPSRLIDSLTPFRQSAQLSRWLEESQGIFRTSIPQEFRRWKLISISSCGTVRLPIKK
jgi:hypothetical protein